MRARAPPLGLPSQSMTKRYKKNPGRPIAPADVSPAGAAPVDLPGFYARLHTLFDHYLAHACPCRFPRFRAAAALDTADVGAPAFAAQDQQALLGVFDERVPLVERVTLPFGHRGRCQKCGASVERWGVEHFKSAWIEYLTLEPTAGSVDVGARVHTPVPHCLPFYAAGPGDRRRGGDRLVELSYPKVGVDEWFGWMEALAELEPASAEFARE